MSGKKETVIAIGVIILILFVVFIIGMALKTPPFPDYWRGVRAGMAKKEIQNLVPETFNLIDPVQRVEIATRSYTILGFRQCRWQLYVDYGTDGKAEKVLAGFFDRKFKHRNIVWRPFEEF